MYCLIERKSNIRLFRLYIYILYQFKINICNDIANKIKLIFHVGILKVVFT